MADNGVELYRYQAGDVILITALAGGNSLRDAAAMAAISERTASRRLSNPAFREEVLRVQSDLMKMATSMLGQCAVEAVTKLRQLMEGAKSESVQLRAARSLLDFRNKAIDTGELMSDAQGMEFLRDIASTAQTAIADQLRMAGVSNDVIKACVNRIGHALRDEHNRREEQKMAIGPKSRDIKKAVLRLADRRR